MLNGLNWNPESLHVFLSSPLIQFVTLAASESGFFDSLASLVCGWLHPLFLQAKTAANQEDNPNWWQAMNGPFHEEFWEAACVEIETLEHMNVGCCFKVQQDECPTLYLGFQDETVP